MAKHFGEKRDPSFGIWKPDNTDNDVEQQDPLTWGAKSPTKDRMAPNPEDDLIAKIDAKRSGQVLEEDDAEREIDTGVAKNVRPNLDLDDEKLSEYDDPEHLARAEKHFAKPVTTLHQSPNKPELTSKEKLGIEIEKYNRQSAEYRKRHPSNAQIGLESQIRKRRKQKHK